MKKLAKARHDDGASCPLLEVECLFLLPALLRSIWGAPLFVARRTPTSSSLWPGTVSESYLLKMPFPLRQPFDKNLDENGQLPYDAQIERKSAGNRNRHSASNNGHDAPSSCLAFARFITKKKAKQDQI